MNQFTLETDGQKRVNAMLETWVERNDIQMPLKAYKELKSLMLRSQTLLSQHTSQGVSQETGIAEHQAA